MNFTLDVQDMKLLQVLKMCNIGPSIHHIHNAKDVTHMRELAHFSNSDRTR